MPDFDGMRAQLTALVVPRESRLTVNTSHEAPALLGEWFPISVQLHNAEASAANSVSVEVSLQQPSGDQNTIDEASE